MCEVSSNKVAFMQKKNDILLLKLQSSNWKLPTLYQQCNVDSVDEFNSFIIFRWKLTQYIIPSKKILFQWKIVNNNRCNFCGNEEDYLHYFITCSFFKTFWEKIYNLLKSNNLDITLKLKHLIFGYKIFDNYYCVKYWSVWPLWQASTSLLLKVPTCT